MIENWFAIMKEKKEKGSENKKLIPLAKYQIQN